mmetsp:Transcript_14332/g.28615  ORF Transcript_14332/g.28615 Transcript_14332/m.28615 type:complete len:292 (-) Transcript_14332:1006-1881(-)
MGATSDSFGDAHEACDDHANAVRIFIAALHRIETEEAPHVDDRYPVVGGILENRLALSDDAHPLHDVRRDGPHRRQQNIVGGRDSLRVRATVVAHDRRPVRQVEDGARRPLRRRAYLRQRVPRRLQRRISPGPRREDDVRIRRHKAGGDGVQAAKSAHDAPGRFFFEAVHAVEEEFCVGVLGEVSAHGFEEGVEGGDQSALEFGLRYFSREEISFDLGEMIIDGPGRGEGGSWGAEDDVLHVVQAWVFQPIVRQMHALLPCIRISIGNAHFLLGGSGGTVGVHNLPLDVLR